MVKLNVIGKAFKALLVKISPLLSRYLRRLGDLPPLPTNHTMTKLESFACFGLVAFISVGFIAGASTASSAINRVEQRLAYRNCLLSRSVEICAAARPLGAKAALIYDARFSK